MRSAGTSNNVLDASIKMYKYKLLIALGQANVASSIFKQYIYSNFV